MMDIIQVTEVSDELGAAFARLIPQLAPSNPGPTKAHLAEVVNSPATTLFIARHPATKEISGSLIVVMYRTLTGLRAWIEDVVVEREARGQGVGMALSQAAIQHATEAGATTIDLTSHPSREAANRLYQRLGFKRRESTVYRYSDSGSDSGSSA